MNVLLAIPARYASSRFEGKPLVDINGKTMIQRVVEQCLKVQHLTGDSIDVIVATDDSRIYDHVKEFGDVMMTSPSHESGTDRVAEVAARAIKVYDVVINVQGDEPLIHPEQIVQLIACFKEPGTKIATLIKPVIYPGDLESPNTVKCVVNHQFKAIYFSRHVIPFYRNNKDMEGKEFYKHIGMYGFTQGILKELTQLPQSILEKAECLEQLRWIENGYEIQTAITHYENISVDSPEDLLKLKPLQDDPA
jgi:3-deoxy-manno-octulosonate cytidylyltransferase (CMP-KDO synthetase)